MHFSQPVPVHPRAWRSSRTPGTSAETIAAPSGRSWHATGKETAIVKDVTGFVLNRLQYALFHEAAQLVEEGIATAEDVDTLVRTTFGFRLPFFGPFAIADMAGLDVYAFCYKSLQTGFPERFATPKILQDLVDAGQAGHQDRRRLPRRPGGTHAGAGRLPQQGLRAMQKLVEELGPAPIN